MTFFNFLSELCPDLTHSYADSERRGTGWRQTKPYCQYHHSYTSQRNRCDSCDEYLENFAMVDAQIGAIFLINGKVVGMDCFGKSGTFEKTFKKIVESFALDAIDWYDSKVDSKRSKTIVNNF